MSYPAALDSYTPPAGTSPLTSPDHAGQHASFGSAIVNIENKLGIGNGSAAANQILVGSGAGTAQWGSVWNSAQLGTPTITGGTFNNQTFGTPSITGGTFNNGVIGTPAITGGTHNTGVFGTMSATGGTINSAVFGTPVISRIGSTSSSDTRIDADTAGTKTVTFTTIRQGGTVTDWSVGGTNTFTAANVFIQAGSGTVGTTSNVTVTFPVAFSKAPVVTIGHQNSSGVTFVIKSVTTGNFVCAGGATQDANSLVYWIAIGER